jgi:hypothetical protein
MWETFSQTKSMIHNHTALVRIANMTPNALRELVYVNDGYARRDHVRRHYRSKGDLVATVYDLYLDGKLPHITRDLDLPRQPEA